MLPHEFLINNVPVQNKQQIADAFNKFYVNIGPNLSKNSTNIDISPMEYMKSPNPHSILLSPATDKEIKDIILSLKTCSSGWDFLTTTVISNNIENILEPLKHVLNLYITKGVFPRN